MRDWQWEKKNGWVSAYDFDTKLALMLMKPGTLGVGDCYKVVKEVDEEGYLICEHRQATDSVAATPFMVLDKETAKQMWEVLDRHFRLEEKIVPAHEVEQANEMRAIKTHLEDMRTLVFDGSLSEKAVKEWNRPVGGIVGGNGPITMGNPKEFGAVVAQPPSFADVERMVDAQAMKDRSLYRDGGEE